MSWMDGISQCLPLAKDCRVWWEAWAAVGSILAVVATTILGVFTYRLGVEAGRAGEAALTVSRQNLDLQEHARRTEANFLLHFLQAEFRRTANRIDDFTARLTDRETDTGELDYSQREAMYRMIPALEMVESAAQLPRLHVLERKQGDVLARSLGSARGLYRALQRFEKNRSEWEEGIQVELAGTRERLHEIATDLRSLSLDGPDDRMS